MPKDYAKRYNQNSKKTSHKRKKSTASSTARSVFVLIIILLVIIAGGTGYFYYHQKLSANKEALLLPPVSDAKAVASKAKANKAPVEEAKEEAVDYEFYTLLPKINVPDPVQNFANPDQQAGFWLQLMIYYNMRDASAYLDKLQLMGLDAVITQRKSTKTDHDLFIVVLGPFTSKENAIARQQELKRMNVSSYIFHVDPQITNAIPNAPSKEISIA